MVVNTLLVSFTHVPMRASYSSKNAQLITNLHQTCVNVVPTTDCQDVFAPPVDNLSRLFKSTSLLTVVLTTCRRPAIQQQVGSKVLQQLEKMTDSSTIRIQGVEHSTRQLQGRRNLILLRKSVFGN